MAKNVISVVTHSCIHFFSQMLGSAAFSVYSLHGSGSAGEARVLTRNDGRRCRSDLSLLFFHYPTLGEAEDRL